MIKPFFAKDRTNPTTLTASASEGNPRLSIYNPFPFHSYEKLFISMPDNTGTEYLGAPLDSDVGWVEVEFPPSKPFSVSSNLWKASYHFAWTSLPAGPRERQYREGVAIERGLGGSLWSVRLAEPGLEETLCFRGLSSEHLSLLRNWLSLRTGGGIEDFTWINPHREVSQVHLVEPGWAEREIDPRVFEVRLPLAVVEEGGYR